MSPEVDSSCAEEGDLLPRLGGAVKDVLPPGDLEAFESCGHDRGLERCFQQHPGYSIGPRVDVAFGTLGNLDKDFDILRRSITVTHTLSEVRGRPDLGPPKTARSARTVAISRALVAELERHLGEFADPDGWIFSSRMENLCGQRTSGAVFGYLHDGRSVSMRSHFTTCDTPMRHG